ncbi:hypothetical protein TNCV_2458211 [Trichonephila clavipes]|nr:hypothetical protein TNCV_2458211 [Trichonephila clavipes]
MKSTDFSSFAIRDLKLLNFHRSTKLVTKSAKNTTKRQNVRNYQRNSTNRPRPLNVASRKKRATKRRGDDDPDLASGQSRVKERIMTSVTFYQILLSRECRDSKGTQSWNHNRRFGISYLEVMLRIGSITRFVCTDSCPFAVQVEFKRPGRIKCKNTNQKLPEFGKTI